MSKYKLIALATVFVAFEQVPAQVTFTSETKLIIVNVTVKDKMGVPIANLKKEDFDVSEDGKPQTVEIFEFEKLSNDLLPVVKEEGTAGQVEEKVQAAPKPAAPKAGAAASVS